jgi:hypothetical protein
VPRVVEFSSSAAPITPRPVAKVRAGGSRGRARRGGCLLQANLVHQVPVICHSRACRENPLVSAFHCSHARQRRASLHCLCSTMGPRDEREDDSRMKRRVKNTLDNNPMIVYMSPCHSIGILFATVNRREDCMSCDLQSGGGPADKCTCTDAPGLQESTSVITGRASSEGAYSMV